MTIQSLPQQNITCKEPSIANKIAAEYNLAISPKETKVIAFHSKKPITAKIIINYKPVEQVMDFKGLGIFICQDINRYEGKNKYVQTICGTIK